MLRPWFDIEKVCVIMLLGILNKINGLLQWNINVNNPLTWMHDWKSHCYRMENMSFCQDRDRDLLTLILPFILMLLQVPVRVDFTMTVNKSRCQSKNKIDLLFTTNLRVHDKPYVFAWTIQGAADLVTLSRKSPMFWWLKYSSANSYFFTYPIQINSYYTHRF